MNATARPSRRSFIKKTAAATAAAALVPSIEAVAYVAPRPAGPVVISSRNGLATVEKAMTLIQQGADALDAVIAGVNLVEADPSDMSVGYGGLPNEEGVVQLDAAVIHGPTHRAGAVAALEGIMHPANVAQLVAERSDHVLLVGAGAQRFARLHGFPIQELLTEEAREVWVRWRENLSTRDDYLPPHGADDRDIGFNLQDWLDFEEQHLHYGTIHCSGIDLSGGISSVTTTSGLSFKMPGRVGDSPIIGAGLYCDNEVGAAGSTGRGEANLKNCASFLIVERMRMGDSPEAACLAACRRIAENTHMARLQDEQGRPNFNVKFYALNRAGDVGGAEIWSNPGGERSTFAVADQDGTRLVDLAPLYKRA